MPDTRKLETTGTPGIFRRHAKDCERHGRCDCSYVIVFRDRGRQHTETFGTFAEAREAKRTRGSQVARGEFSALARVTLREYALEWIDRYQGTGRRGFREETREEYRAALDRYALRWFPPGLLLGELTPRLVAEFIGWLADGGAQAKHDHALRLERARQDDKPPPAPLAPGARRELSDSTIRNAFKPLSGCLATARREGLLRHNPATDATLPYRARIDDDERERRPLSREQLAAFLAIVHPDHRLMLDFAARTGLRCSEILGLDGRHLHLTGEQPHVKVRQRYRNGRLGPIKTRYARRDVPLAPDLVDRLRALGRAPDEPVFRSTVGTRLQKDNVRNRVIRPAAEEAGASWAGWHTFRHTCASILFAEGRNVVQVQRWLGHHKPSFTIDTYIHLLDGDLGEPLAASQVNTGSTQRPQTAANGAAPHPAEVAA